MKLFSLFSKKAKSPAPSRDSNLSADPSSRISKRPSRNSRTTGRPSAYTNHRIELRRPVLDELFEIEHQQLSEAFRIIDKNGDGKISKQELGTLWEMLGEKVTDQELRIMVQDVDENGDGEIDLREFVTLNETVGLGIEDPDAHAEELRVAFSVADADRDGHISAAELQEVMKRLGMKNVSHAESSEMLRIVDSEVGGWFNFENFKRLMTSTIFGSEH